MIFYDFVSKTDVITNKTASPSKKRIYRMIFFGFVVENPRGQKHKM